MVKIGKRNEYGYDVTLLDYNNASGFVTLSELSRRSRHRKKNIVDQGDIMPMTVLVSDQEKETIDLSKRYLRQDEVDEINDQFKYKHNIHRIGIEIYKLFCNYDKTKDKDIEQIFENTIWNLYDKNENVTPQVIFNNIIANPVDIFSGANCEELFGKYFIEEICKNITNRVTKKDSSLEMDLRVLILDEKGIDSLKEIFDLNNEIENNKLTIKFPSPPIYNLLLEGDDENELRQILEKIKLIVETKTKERGGLFSIQSDIKIVKESKLDLKFISDYDLDKIIV